MISGHGNHLIDGDMGDNPKSPNYKGKDDYLSSKFVVKYTDDEIDGWKEDKSEDLQDLEVNLDNIYELISREILAEVNVHNYVVILNNVDEVVVESLEDVHGEKERYELYYC